MQATSMLVVHMTTLGRHSNCLITDIKQLESMTEQQLPQMEARHLEWMA